MSVKKTKSGYAVVHCHGKKKGKIIAKHETKEEALAQHQAIQISKKRQKVPKSKKK